MIKYIAGIVVIAVLAVVAIWRLNRQPTLIDLQRAYLFAKTNAEREKVIDLLEDYYLNLSIPDSVRLVVDEEVDTLLKTTSINMSEFSEENWDTINVYNLEGQLKSLHKTAMIACAREEDKSFRQLMDLGQKMARVVDKGTQGDYWEKFVDEKSGASKEQAKDWLKAEKAARLCRDFHDGENWRLGECYGSIGLNYLSKINDPRLKLDILQRLQFILYSFRGLFDLSVALAEQSLVEAKKTNYILRAQGIAYHQADAFFENGNIGKALNKFKQLRINAEEHNEVPFMSWYLTKSLIRIADSYFWLGRLNNALSICEELENYELTESNKILSYITKGLVNRGLGNYHEAETAYNKALAIADSIEEVANEIRTLNNIGFMYYELTENDEALKHYNQVQALINEFFPGELEYKINLYINIAKVKAKQGKIETVEELLNDANELLRKLGFLPMRKADMLITLATFSSEIGKTKEAIKGFREAELLCEEHGLTRLGLETKLKLAECMMLLERYSEAKHKINEVFHKATQYEDIERVIDSLALLADLEYKEGDLEKAVETSDRLINEIETIIRLGFEDSRRLISYHQKIYDYLKNAVIYEILRNRLDYAFAKLDYAKSLSSRYHAVTGNGIYENGKANNRIDYIDLLKSQIEEQSSIMNFMLAKDTLYVFTLDRDGLQLFRKKINFDSLRKTVDEYVKTIDKTVEIFNNYDVKAIETHFDETTHLGHRLFQILMGWPELLVSLQEVDFIYLIPDEFLFRIPFSTLVISDDSEQLTYLTHKVAVINLPSASFLASKNAGLKKFDSNNLDVLISADPNFQEMDKFVSYFKKKIPSFQIMAIDKDKIEKTDIIEKLNENFDIYVFLGHSVANVLEPELSYIEVSCKSSLSSMSKIFKVSLSDLRSLNWLSPELVMLVGCETAAGKLYLGSGFLGLQNVLLASGAQNVLASLWKIDASQAIPQAKDYLKIYLQDPNPAGALRKTQNKSIKYLSNHSYYRKPHPYFWGSYTLYKNAN